MKCGKRTLALAVVVMGLLVPALLPSLVVRPEIAPLLMRWSGWSLPGELKMERCSLGWFRGLRCEQVRYVDPELGIRFHAPRLTTDKGLFALLLAPFYWGEVVVEHPELLLERPPGEIVRRLPRGPLIAGAPWWERFSFRAQVYDGRIGVREGVFPGTPRLQAVQFSGNLAAGRVEYAVECAPGSIDGGRLHSTGYINLPPLDPALREAVVVAGMDLEFRRTGLADLLAWTTTGLGKPGTEAIGGLLDGVVHVRTLGKNDLELRGGVSVHGLRLPETSLGLEQTALDKLRLDGHGGYRRGSGWRLDRLDLQTPLGQVKAGGTVHGAVAELSVEGSLDLATLVRRSPKLVRIFDRTELRRGKMDFSGRLRGTPTDLQGEASVQSGELEWWREGRAHRWTAPVQLSVAGIRDSRGVRLRTLRGEAPFASLQGKGGLDDLDLEATIDLDALSAELRQLMELERSPRGEVRLTLSSRARQDEEYWLEGRMRLARFALHEGKAVSVPAHEADLVLGCGLRPAAPKGLRLRSLLFTGQGWPGRWSLVAQRTLASSVSSASAALSSAGQQAGSAPTSCVLEGRLDLHRLLSLIRAVRGTGEPAVAVRGEFDFSGSGSWQRQRVELRHFIGTFKQVAVLAVHQGDAPLVAEQSATLSLDNQPLGGSQVAIGDLLVQASRDAVAEDLPLAGFDSDQRWLGVHHLRLRGRDIRASLWLDLADWQTGTPLTLRLRTEMPSATLGCLALLSGWLRPEVQLAGTARLACSWQADRGEGSGDLALILDGFEVREGKERLFADPRLQSTMQLGWDQETRAVGISSLALRTAPFSLEGSGLVQTARKPPLLEAQGTIKPAPFSFAALLAPLLAPGRMMPTGQPGTFLFALPLEPPLRTDRITLTGSLPVARLDYRGRTLHDRVVPLEYGGGVLRLDQEGMRPLGP
ncbi:MAG: hypothetical protein ACOX5Z_10225 [Desulfobulbus sp.]